MPRDLTDLMERATSFAPPELHAADDITRLAQHAQRRRTTGLAAGLAVAVIAAAAIGYGTTRDRADRDQQPISPYQTGVHQSLAKAVTADAAPGFTALDYGVPSYADLGKDLQPAPRYADVDASGRLLVQNPTTDDANGTITLTTTYQLLDGPGATPASVTAPPLAFPPASLAHVSFSGAGGLAWQS